MSPAEKFKLFFSPFLESKQHLLLYLLRVAMYTIFGGVTLAYLLSSVSKYLLEKNTTGFENLLIGFGVSLVVYYFLTWVTRNTWVAMIKSRSWIYLHRRYIPLIISLENNYAETIGSARLFSIFDKGGLAWNDALQKVFEQFTRLLMIIVPAFYIIITHSIRFFIVTLIILVVAAVFVYFIQKRVLHSRKEKANAITEYDRALIKTVQSRFEILQSQALEHELWILDKKNQKYARMLQEQIAQQLMMYQGVRVFSYIILALAYWSFGQAYLAWEIPLETIILVASLIASVSTVLFDMTQAYLDLGQQIIQIENLWEKIDLAEKTPNIFKGDIFKYSGGTIAFQWVDLAYIENNPILQNFSFTFEAGKKYALIGKSGGGKTTIMKLACAFIHPTTGKVLIDGQDLTKVCLSDFYSNIGYLTQDPQVFDGTIRENLLLGNQIDVSEASISRALSDAEADFIHTLPQWLETEIGERGIKLSGGQRQRLAIAKIFLKNPKIIMLDEPTSALDSTSEEAIARAFEKLFQGKTVIIIAHRLKTVQQVDTILVIENGTIVESGTHSELSESHGIYARMLVAQIHF